MKKNLFELYMNKILTPPLWVKQVIFMKLFQEMKKNGCENFNCNELCELYSTHIPILTFKGRTELSEKELGLGENIYNFLQYCENGYSIIDICLNAYHSMEEVSKYYLFCMEEGFVESPENVKIKSMVAYIAGKYRLGEYCLQAGIVSQEQINDALSHYKKSVEAGKNIRFGQILCELNFVSASEIKSVMLFKEDADKRVILDHEALPKSELVYTDEKSLYEAEIKGLKQENIMLKDKLNKLLELVK